MPWKTKEERKLDRALLRKVLKKNQAIRLKACQAIGPLFEKCRTLDETKMGKTKLDIPHRNRAWANSKRHFPRVIWTSKCGSHERETAPGPSEYSRCNHPTTRMLPSFTEQSRFTVVGSIPRSFLGYMGPQAVSAQELELLAVLVKELPPKVVFHHDDGHEFYWVNAGGMKFEVTIFETRLDRLLSLVFRVHGKLVRVLFYLVRDEEEEAKKETEEEAKGKEGKGKEKVKEYPLLVVSVFVDRIQYLKVLWSVDQYLDGGELQTQQLMQTLRGGVNLDRHDQEVESVTGRMQATTS